MNDVLFNLLVILLKWISKLLVNIYNMEDLGIVIVLDIVWFMVFNIEFVE